MPKIIFDTEHIHTGLISDIMYNGRHHEFIEAQHINGGEWELFWDDYNNFTSKAPDHSLIPGQLEFKDNKLQVTMLVKSELNQHSTMLSHVCRINSAIGVFLNATNPESVNIALRNEFDYNQSSQSEIVRKLNHWWDTLQQGWCSNIMDLLTLGAILKKFYMAEEADDEFILSPDALVKVKRLLDKRIDFNDVAFHDLLTNHSFQYAYVEEPRFANTGFTRVKFLNNAIGIFPNFLHYRDNKELKILDVIERQASVV